MEGDILIVIMEHCDEFQDLFFHIPMVTSHIFPLKWWTLNKYISEICKAPSGSVLIRLMNPPLRMSHMNSSSFCLSDVCYFLIVANFGPFSSSIHFFQNVSSQAPSGRFKHIIPTFNWELNEICGKMIFYIFWLKNGGFWGRVNQNALLENCTP